MLCGHLLYQIFVPLPLCLLPVCAGVLPVHLREHPDGYWRFSNLHRGDGLP